MKLIPLSTNKFTHFAYPKFLREHAYLKTNPTIQKVFPLIGLPNASYPIRRPNKRASKLSVVFSSDPWDMTTMSMRGIESCQSWGRFGDYNDYDNYMPQNAHCRKLTGSIIDPCCAIIYITDHTPTQYGSKMLARAVV